MVQLETPDHAMTDDLIQRIANELKWKVSGEVRFDARARALYATDASPYEILPYGVVLPKTNDDIRHVVEIANRYRIPILMRGGGTSLAGQTVARAIVIDVSKYMTEVLEFNPEQRWVKVQPGVVRDNLNEFLKPYKLQFTPDVSTTNRSNVGGMVANNSAGTRSIKYGKSVDQVIAMTVMLADGSVVEMRELSDSELQHKLKMQGLEGQIYQTVYQVTRDHTDEIAARFPKVMRRVGGYNLDELTPEKPFNLAKLVAGSEGTLAIILDVTLQLFPVPTHRSLALLHFNNFRASMQAVPFINEHGPSAVETIDDRLFELASQNPNLVPLMDWVKGRPAAVLVVEFDGETFESMRGGLERMQADARIQALTYHTHLAFDPAEQARVLELRKAGLGIYATTKGDRKPVAFIEDAAIPPEHLADYIPEVLTLCQSMGVDMVMYGHASVGVIHVRPILNLKDPQDIALYQKISEATFELVKKYGGSWSGEHGDGLIRSYQNKNLFGELLYEDFRRIKRAFDPANLMNPGKIVDAPAMTENLRYGESYPRVELKTYFDFSADGGYLGAVEMCSGVGACRKTTTGTMCPSYMVTRDEDHSTRGRANILREALTGKLPGGLTSQEVYGVLDLCLECKACKAECPSQVDMAKLKYEFLQHYYDAHGTPAAVQAFANVYKTAPLGRLAAPLANALLPLKPVRWVLEKTLGVDKRRVMPPYANQGFDSWMREHQEERQVDSTKPTVALFADTWTMYHEPEVGIAATRVLEALGFSVELIDYQCCGRTLISKGLLKDAKVQAAHNVAQLTPYLQRDIPIVGLEPSCITAFQDDYRDLVPGEQTEAVAKHVRMIDQFLVKAWTQGELDPQTVFRKMPDPILLHGHCQQRAIIGTRASQAVLNWISEDVREVDSGCCGMAGSFGYSHYDLSMKLGERRLFPAVRNHAGAVAACGFSCRHQIKDGTGRRAEHVIELLAANLKVPCSDNPDEVPDGKPALTAKH